MSFTERFKLMWRSVCKSKKVSCESTFTSKRSASKELIIHFGTSNWKTSLNRLSILSLSCSGWDKNTSTSLIWSFKFSNIANCENWLFLKFLRYSSSWFLKLVILLLTFTRFNFLPTKVLLRWLNSTYKSDI